jgi:hypothetical protein
LLDQLVDDDERAIVIQPDVLSLKYISNSTILSCLDELGVRLDTFFKLLWRHVFVVEVLRHHFHINNEKDKASVIQRITSLFKNNKHEQALKYLEEYGRSFWEETEYRIKEVTHKLEEDVKSAVRTGVPTFAFSATANQALTT